MRLQHLACGLVLSALALSAVADDKGKEKDAVKQKETEKRVKELLAVIADPEAGGKRLKESVAAETELTGIGVAAAPQLVDVVADGKPSTRVGNTATRLLNTLGEDGLPAIRARWPGLSDEQRWRFMPLL